MELKTTEVIIGGILVLALLAVPVATAYFVFGRLRKEVTPAAEAQADLENETASEYEHEAVVAAPRHSRHRPSSSPRRRHTPDLRNRFGRK